MIKRNTWIVLGVFAALLLVAVFWDKLPAGEGAAEDAVPTLVPMSPPLLDVTYDQIIEVNIRQREGEEVTLRLGEERDWEMVSPVRAGADELNIMMIEQILWQLIELRELTAMEPISELETVGLAYPAYRIKLGLENGETLQVDVGDMTVTGTGYYVRVRGRLPQVVASGIVDSVVAMVEFPPLLPTPVPTIEPTAEPEASESP